jgi:hypothetical protein
VNAQNVFMQTDEESEEKLFAGNDNWIKAGG